MLGSFLVSIAYRFPSGFSLGDREVEKPYPVSGFLALVEFFDDFLEDSSGFNGVMKTYKGLTGAYFWIFGLMSVCIGGDITCRFLSGF